MKKFIAFLLVFAFVLPVSAFAIPETGQLGDSVFYEYDAESRSVRIYGSGDMWDFRFPDEPELVPVEPAPLSPFYEAELRTAVIEDGVTSLGEALFEGCVGLTDVSVGKDVRRLGIFALASGYIQRVYFHGDAPELCLTPSGGSYTFTVQPYICRHAVVYHKAGTQGWDSGIFLDEIRTFETERTFSDFADLALVPEAYRNAVQWAGDAGISTGYADGTFRGNEPCTRAQALTLLWRGMGCPRSAARPDFPDIDRNAYYYDALCWAVENGVVLGYKDGTFRPHETVNRGQCVTFFYRVGGSPRVWPTHPFSDVDSLCAYSRAIEWGSLRGAVQGYPDGSFRPYESCTRQQLVTFLYREYPLIRSRSELS